MNKMIDATKISKANKGRTDWNKGMYGQLFGKNLKKKTESDDSKDNNLTNN